MSSNISELGRFSNLPISALFPSLPRVRVVFHRTAGTGGDLQRSNLPAKAGSIDQAAQGGIQAGLEYLHLIQQWP